MKKIKRINTTIAAALFALGNCTGAMGADYTVDNYDTSNERNLKDSMQGTYTDTDSTQYTVSSGDRLILDGTVTKTETSALASTIDNLIIGGSGTLNSSSTSNEGLINQNSNTLTIQNATISGFSTAIQNASGNLILDNAIIDNTNTVGINNAGTLNVNNSSTLYSLTNSGNATISSLLNSDITINQTSSSANTTLEQVLNLNNSTVSGGNITFSGDGTYNIKGSNLEGSNIISNNANTVLNIQEGSSISANSTTYTNGTVQISGGSAELTGTNVTVIANDSDNSSTAGNLTLNNVTLTQTSSIEAKTKTDITNGINVNGAKVILNSNDTISGAITSDNASGDVQITDVDMTSANIIATKGSLTATGSGSAQSINLSDNGQIADDVNVTFNNVSLSLDGNSGVYLSSADSITSTAIQVNGSNSSLTLEGDLSGKITELSAQAGQVTLESASLKLKSGSSIISSVTTLLNGSTNLIIDGADVAISGTTSSISDGSAIELNSGSLNLSSITGSNFTLTADGGDLTLNSVELGGGSLIDSAVNLTVNGNVTVNNATLKLDGASDSFNSGTIKANSTSSSITIANVTTDSTKSLSLEQGSTISLDNVTLNNSNDKVTADSVSVGSNGLNIQQGSVSLNKDNISGKLTQTGGSLTVSSGLVTSTTGARIESSAGNLTLTNATLNGGDSITTTGLKLAGTTEIQNASVTINSGSDLSDLTLLTLNSASGNLTFDSTGSISKEIQAETGNLTASGTSALTLTGGSYIKTAVIADLSGASLTLDGTSDVVLDSSDTWNTSTTLKSSASLTLDYVSQGANSTLAAEGGSLTLSSGQSLDIASSSYINDDVEMKIKDNSSISISGGSVNVSSNDTLTSGEISIDSGNLVFKDNATNSNFKIKANGGSVEVNNAEFANSSDIIAKAADLNISGNLTISDGEVNINGSDVWSGEVTLNSGTLNIENIVADNKVLKAAGGILNITGTEDNTSLSLAANSYINQAVQVDLDGALTLANSNVTVILDGATDTLTSGHIGMSAGSLTMSNLDTTNAYLKAEGGDLIVNNVIFNNDKDEILFAVNATINGPVNVQKGLFELDSNDDISNITGAITLNGDSATMRLDGIQSTATAQLAALNGNLGIVGSGVTMNNSSDIIERAVKTTIEGDLNQNDGMVYLNENDTWNSGTISLNTNAKMQMQNFNVKSSQTLTSNGSAQLELINSSVNLANAQNISDGVFSVDDTSKINLSSGAMHLTNLNSSGLVGAISNSFDVQNVDTLTVLNSPYTTMDGTVITTDGSAAFAIDILARHWEKVYNDQFKGNNITLSDTTNEGIINISDWKLNGNITREDAPTERTYKLKLFDYTNIDDNIKFAASQKEELTPIGYYKLIAGTEGNYILQLTRYNPQVFRGQAATLAQYNNQLAVNDMLQNHVSLSNEVNLANMSQNKYAAATPNLGPYLYSQEDGGVWFKAYNDIERVELSEGINVDAINYGSIIGIDFPVKKLKSGWKFIPTPYLGYNGAHQSFNDVSMYQNGGQAGFMGTFMKNNFISSHTLYGGGYYNEMHVDSVKDETANWFWGTAHKAAYNINFGKHFILQPTGTISYNMFGEQNYHSSFGEMSMHTGMLNGINIVPGANLIFKKDDWSLYASLQYTWNINEQVSARAGSVDLPNLKMRHGYVQYGLGGTKNIKDNISAYGQVMFRNGGRNGVAFQIGMQYFLDWANIFKKTKTGLLLFKHKNKVSLKK